MEFKIVGGYASLVDPGVELGMYAYPAPPQNGDRIDLHDGREAVVRGRKWYDNAPTIVYVDIFTEADG